MALILLRHTRPLGSDGVCYGITDLAPGPDLANEARRLHAQLPEVTAILSSPLQRCLRLAEALGKARGLEVATDPRLREIDFGAWEGLRWDDIPRDQIDAWAADVAGARPHGGESALMLAGRAGQALEAAPEGALVVTHMGVIRAALARAGEPGAWQARVPFGGWIRLWRDLTPGSPSTAYRHSQGRPRG